MKRATLPYNFHICISTAAGTLLTPQITVLLQPCVTTANCSWASRAKETFWFLHRKQAPAWTSSSAHLQQDCRASHGVRRSRAYPRVTAHPAQGGRAGMQGDTRVAAVCAAEEGLLSHTSCLAGPGCHSPSLDPSMGEVSRQLHQPLSALKSFFFLPFSSMIKMAIYTKVPGMPHSHSSW